VETARQLKDQADVESWLHGQVAISGVDPLHVRLLAQVRLDVDTVDHSDPKELEWMGDQQEEILAAYEKHAWWYSELSVAVLVEGHQLSVAYLSGVAEGAVPGGPYTTAWEDMSEEWLTLAKEAVADAKVTLEQLRQVALVWADDIETDAVLETQQSPS
jgi:hypothetical protein